MRKPFLAIILVITSMSVFAQENSSRSVQLGIKVAPCISYARVTDKNNNDGVSFSQGGTTMKFVIGPYIDLAINNNVSFSTGLWYSPRAVVLNSKIKDSATVKSIYNLQYVMLPAYFKFTTNEIAPGLKAYITLGGTFDIKLIEKKQGDDNVGLKEQAEKSNKKLFTAVDATIMAGAGVEVRLKDVTTFYAGISYNRGLVNIINPLLQFDSNGNTVKPYQNISIKNNLLGLDLGIRF